MKRSGKAGRIANDTAAKSDHGIAPLDALGVEKAKDLLSRSERLESLAVADHKRCGRDPGLLQRTLNLLAIEPEDLAV